MICVDARRQTHKPIRGGVADVQRLFASGNRIQAASARIRWLFAAPDAAAVSASRII